MHLYGIHTYVLHNVLYTHTDQMHGQSPLLRKWLEAGAVCTAVAGPCDCYSAVVDGGGGCDCGRGYTCKHWHNVRKFWGRSSPDSPAPTIAGINPTHIDSTTATDRSTSARYLYTLWSVIIRNHNELRMLCSTTYCHSVRLSQLIESCWWWVVYRVTVTVRMVTMA